MYKIYIGSEIRKQLSKERLKEMESKRFNTIGEYVYYITTTFGSHLLGYSPNAYSTFPINSRKRIKFIKEGD